MWLERKDTISKHSDMRIPQNTLNSHNITVLLYVNNASIKSISRDRVMKSHVYSERIPNLCSFLWFAPIWLHFICQLVGHADFVYPVDFTWKCEACILLQDGGKNQTFLTKGTQRPVLVVGPISKLRRTGYIYHLFSCNFTSTVAMDRKLCHAERF